MTMFINEFDNFCIHGCNSGVTTHGIFQPTSPRRCLLVHTINGVHEVAAINQHRSSLCRCRKGLHKFNVIWNYSWNISNWGPNHWNKISHLVSKILLRNLFQNLFEVTIFPLGIRIMIVIVNEFNNSIINSCSSCFTSKLTFGPTFPNSFRSFQPFDCVHEIAAIDHHWSSFLRGRKGLHKFYVIWKYSSKIWKWILLRMNGIN